MAPEGSGGFRRELWHQKGVVAPGYFDHRIKETGDRRIMEKFDYRIMEMLGHRVMAEWGQGVRKERRKREGKKGSYLKLREESTNIGLLKGLFIIR